MSRGDPDTRIRETYRADESTVVAELIAECAPLREALGRSRERARGMIEQARRRHSFLGDLNDVLHEFPLSTDEGHALMALAEALLRIPDIGTVERLIAEKLRAGNWTERADAADSVLGKVAAQALATASSIARPPGDAHAGDFVQRLLSDAAAPLVRHAALHAVRLIGRKFVFSENIKEALQRVEHGSRRGYWYSFDMLGEAARTRADAQRYFESYMAAIRTVGRRQRAVARGQAALADGSGETRGGEGQGRGGEGQGRDGEGQGPAGERQPLGVSVKLSALHPRLEFAKRPAVVQQTAASLLELARAAASLDVPLTVDAEEADRLELSLEIFRSVAGDPSLRGWNGLGLAVQAYQKRARHVVDWVIALAGEQHRRIAVRLVKGAYWDAEIKRAQERGLDGYPVFTRKSTTDLSYTACAARLLAARGSVYPQFATHNAVTVATVLELAGAARDFEFQRLHGMGEALYDPLVDPSVREPLRCRVYAPVGTQHDLLAYLVRRLLENGANTSFLNQFSDANVPTEKLLADPLAAAAALPSKPHPRIPLPRDLFAPERRNSSGIDLSDSIALAGLGDELRAAAAADWTAAPLVSGRTRGNGWRNVWSPAQPSRSIGRWRAADMAVIAEAAERAHGAQAEWDAAGAAARAATLRRFADDIERHRGEFIYLAVHEGGKTLPDAVAEVREAVDYCRYYAACAERSFGDPIELRGVTGERNTLALHGRGVFACISPWNFPLAIFLGQVTGALAAGNSVVAKPAEQTPLIAARAVALLHQAGIPADVLQLIPGEGDVGAALIRHPSIAGVAFTGSTETARAINRALAERSGPIVPFIAETGGVNAMIADASALPEQVVDDALLSAYRSAGQRCSALRLLCVHQGIADRVIDMLRGAMEDLELGDPAELRTDLGPVIDGSSLQTLTQYVNRMRREGFTVHAPVRTAPKHGHFMQPHLIELASARQLSGEIFGPILHVLRFSEERLPALLGDIAAAGYGLTLGIHSRLEGRVKEVTAALHVGNTYVNRNMIGAVVGVQPFGGEGLSGTGPKAGGPHYLLRFAAERTLSINTAVLGGNAALLDLGD